MLQKEVKINDTSIIIYIAHTDTLAAFAEKYSMEEGQLSSLIAPRYRDLYNRMKPEKSKKAELLSGLLLKEYLGIDSDDQLSINQFGKPDFASGQEHFSLSHTGSYVALAWCKEANTNLGIDMEEIGRVNDRVARRLFPDQWQTSIPEDFTRYWTLYEASIKAIGCGFAQKTSPEQILESAQSSYSFVHDNCYISVVCYANC